jgi:CHASE1-domain containing sensor protein
MRYSAIAIFLAVVLVSGTAFAGAQSRNDEGTKVRISELEQRSAALQKRMSGAQKLGASEREELAHERSEIQKMIKRLEAGGSVEPREIER